MSETTSIPESSVIFDLETHGLDTNIAKIKWFGAYSYKSKQFYKVPYKRNEIYIKKFMESHKNVISYNGDNFDIPICKNHGFMTHFLKSLDLLPILRPALKGNSALQGKGRGVLMKLKTKGHSMKEVAKFWKLPTQKGDIDYKIFEKDVWTEEEIEEIKKYLHSDIEITKMIFEKMYEFFSVFKRFLSQKNIDNWSWFTCSSGALSYKVICNMCGLPEIYGEKGEKTEIGGRLVLPKVSTAINVWYVDVASLYPHIFMMFNLFAEVMEGINNNHFHSNTLFKTVGYYDSVNLSKGSQMLQQMYIARRKLKREDPDNPLVYAYKIIMNGVYGIVRSSVFTSVHTLNAGQDCCRLGQQIHEIIESGMTELGYECVYGATDSLFLKHPVNKTREDVKNDLNVVIKKILKHVPFPSDTFDIDIEDFLYYVMFGENKKEQEMLKNNYLYVYEKNGVKDIHITGLPIMKDNATKLGMFIFNKYLKEQIIKNNNGKFKKEYLVDLIINELKNNIELMAIDYRVKSYDSYSFKGKNCLTAQISKNYLNGKSGFVKMVKNNKIGKVGKGSKYCSLEEAKNLTINDLDLTKIHNELNIFCEEPLIYKKGRPIRVKGLFG